MQALCTLFVETCEEFPSEYFVYSFFQSLGELGVLTAAAALLVGRPQTVCRGVSPSCGRDEYRTSQRAAVLRAVSAIASDVRRRWSSVLR